MTLAKSFATKLAVLLALALLAAAAPPAQARHRCRHCDGPHWRHNARHHTRHVHDGSRYALSSARGKRHLLGTTD